jgi:acyl dehydratase
MNSSDGDAVIREAMSKIDASADATYVREVTGDLIAQFAEVSGDNSPVHLDTEYAARTTPYGKRIAHGALLVGFMSTASTILSAKIERAIGRANVSLGYDRVRFTAPVFEGDIITTRIRILSVDSARLRAICEESCTNQFGATVAVSQHVMRFV